MNSAIRMFEDEAGIPAESAEIPGFAFTDTGNGERIVHYHGRDLLYIQGKSINSPGTWLVWTGTHWQPDASLEVDRRAEHAIRQMLVEASKIEDRNRQQELTTFALKSESDGRIRAAISRARSRVAVLRSKFDSNPMLLACKNGTLDLDTGTFREARREDYITKVANAYYNPAADCPLWKKFLAEVTKGSPGFVRYLQQQGGLALTGSVLDHQFCILWGPGGAGKSTFAETITHVMGDYACMVPTDTLMVKRHGGINNDIARLHKVRFVCSNETDAGARLAEALIKNLTGGDSITARLLYQEYFEFVPEFKLWLRTNHKPVIRNNDSGVWRRIKLIPFPNEIPKERVDIRLKDKLKDEASGIFNWMVEGLNDYLANGLVEPEEVVNATADYRKEMDTVRQFIDEHCEVSPNAYVPKADFYAQYQRWCAQRGVLPKGSHSLKDAMEQLGITDFQLQARDRRRRWQGVRLVKSVEPVAGDSEPDPLF